jgi:colanic acid biosynthesis glycosyl transferase WcaI
LRILVVSQYFPPEPSRIGDLAQGLVERGHRVTVLTGKPNYPGGSLYSGYGFFRPAREDYHGAQVVRVPLVPRGSGSARRLALNYLSYAFFASFLGPLLCRDRFDLVFVCQLSPFTVGVPGMVFRALKQAPMMFWVQDLWPESLRASGVVRSPWIIRPIEKLVRFTYERCDRILVVSEGFVPRIEAMGADTGRVRYWPQWAEALYKPVEVEEDVPERSQMPDGFKVVFAGNVGAAQSFETIVAAAEKLKDYPEIHWVVLGDGRKKRWVEEQVRKLGLEDRVRLLGNRPMGSMPRYFALADAMLVTLKKDLIFSLTVPGKVQSYLACGRPVVASLDGEGARVIEEARAGLTAPAEDADALAKAVLKLYEMSSEERGVLGRRSRFYFEEHFERENLLDRLEGWVEELVGEKAQRCAS